MCFKIFKKKTFAEIYQNGNKENYDRRDARKLAKKASNNKEIIIVLGHMIGSLLDYKEKDSLIARLDTSSLEPKDRIFLWNETHNLEWLRTMSFGNNLSLALLVVENLYLFKSFSEDAKYYKFALANATGLALEKDSQVSVKELCFIYNHSKDQRIWNAIKKRTTRFQDSVDVVNWIPGNKAAYTLCLSYTKTPKQFHDVPMYNTNSALKALYFKKAKEIFLRS